MVLGTPAKAPRTRSDRHHLATFSKANQTRNRNSICDLGAHGMTSNLSELQEISYTFQYPLILVMKSWTIPDFSSGYHEIGKQLRVDSCLSTSETRKPMVVPKYHQPQWPEYAKPADLDDWEILHQLIRRILSSLVVQDFVHQTCFFFRIIHLTVSRIGKQKVWCW